VVEDANFPGMQQWPKSFVLKDEIYQIKDFSRSKVRVLMRLDAARLDLNNPRVHRKDLDFAVTWAKMYGKGRVLLLNSGPPGAKLGRSQDPENVRGGYQMGHGSR